MTNEEGAWVVVQALWEFEPGDYAYRRLSDGREIIARITGPFTSSFRNDEYWEVRYPNGTGAPAPRSDLRGVPRDEGRKEFERHRDTFFHSKQWQWERQNFSPAQERFLRDQAPRVPYPGGPPAGLSSLPFSVPQRTTRKRRSS